MTDAESSAAWADRSRAIGEGRIGPRQVAFAEVDRPFGLMQRIGLALSGVEMRTITSLPWNTGSPLQVPSTAPSADNALALGAVYAAVSLIARNLAALPLRAYRDVNGQKTELSQLPALFDQPSVQGDLFDWIHRAVTSLALHGNVYGLITNRDGYGFPTGIEWLNPEHVTVVDFAFTGSGSFLDPIWRWRGRVIPREDLVHIPWFTRPWKVLGLSPLQAYASSINVGLGAQSMSQDWFNNGGVPPGKFKNAMKTVPREEAEEISDRLVDRIRRHRPLVYGADWEYTPFEVSPTEARFIETMKLTATQIAAIYGVPPEKIGGERGSSLTYSSTEQESIDMVQFTLLSYARKLESAFFKLMPARQYVRFDLDSFIRTDMLTRYKIYQLSRAMGKNSIDEIRAKENEPPLPNGEGDNYAPLLPTGFAVETPEDAQNQPDLDELSKLINLPLRRPYSDAESQQGRTLRLANEMRQLVDMPPKPPDVYVTVNIPERQTQQGDVYIQPSLPAEVRIEQPINVQAPTVQVDAPVSVTVPERGVEVINNVAPANAPEVTVPITVHPANADVRIEAPVTVNTPEIQVQPADVTVTAPVVNVAMPRPEPPGDVEVLDGQGKVISRTRRVKRGTGS